LSAGVIHVSLAGRKACKVFHITFDESEVFMFSFNGCDLKNGLGDISFCAAPGERVALVGPLSRGCDALTWVLGGEVKPEQGMVLLNGRPPAEGEVFFVPGDNHFFGEAAIHCFFKWYNKPGACSPEDREELLKALRLTALVRELSRPNGNYHVRGISTGEKLCMAVACAALCPAPVLVLENPLCPCDFETADNFWSYAETKMPGKTMVYCTYEPAFALRAQRICYVNSTIVASGSHEDLYNNCPGYQAQFAAAARQYGIELPAKI
jgi:ABC-type multidrug transport system ATPase subunit